MSATLQAPPSAPSNGKPKLKRSMGLWMATALVVGNMVGSGVFLLAGAAYLTVFWPAVGDNKLLGAGAHDAR
jgi:APA family basic amino acid/polyamine antiporter